MRKSDCNSAGEAEKTSEQINSNTIDEPKKHVLTQTLNEKNYIKPNNHSMKKNVINEFNLNYIQFESPIHRFLSIILKYILFTKYFNLDQRN